MLSQEFMRNALLAGTFIALASGVIGWFVVLRGQVFAGDALSHVAFPGALAAAGGGDRRARGAVRGDGRGGRGDRAAAAGARSPAPARGAPDAPADDTTIGVVFTFVLALGVLLPDALQRRAPPAARASMAARTLFGSIFGLGERRSAAGGGDRRGRGGGAAGDRPPAAVRLGLSRGGGRAGRADAPAGSRLPGAAGGRRRRGDAGRGGAAAARAARGSRRRRAPARRQPVRGDRARRSDGACGDVGRVGAQLRAARAAAWHARSWRSRSGSTPPLPSCR